MKDKKSELDYLNIIFCLVVIFIHIASMTLFSDYAPLDEKTVLFKRLFYFYKLSVFPVQGFIFISAIKLGLQISADKLHSTKYIFKRFYKIFLPYVVWFIIYAYYLKLSPDYTFDTSHISYQFLTGTIITHLYFVPVIMQFYILAPLWRVLLKKGNPAVYVPIALLIQIICLYAMGDIYYYLTKGQQQGFSSSLFSAYLFFWCIGLGIGFNYNTVIEKIKSATPICLIIALGSGWLLAWSLRIITFEEHMLYYTDLLYILYQSAVILFLLGLFRIIGKNHMPYLLKMVSNSTYAIYLAHVLFLYIAQDYAKFYKIKAPLKVANCRVYSALICIEGCVVFCYVKSVIKEKMFKKKVI